MEMMPRKLVFVPQDLGPESHRDAVAVVGPGGGGWSCGGTRASTCSRFLARCRSLPSPAQRGCKALVPQGVLEARLVRQQCVQAWREEGSPSHQDCPAGLKRSR